MNGLLWFGIIAGLVVIAWTSVTTLVDLWRTYAGGDDE